MVRRAFLLQTEVSLNFFDQPRSYLFRTMIREDS